MTGRAGWGGASALATLGALVVGACASRGDAPEMAANGCYYFERDAVAERLQLPWGVRLLPDSLTGWPAWAGEPGVRRAETLVGHERSESFPFGYWRPLPGDSLEIGYPAGGGLVVRVARGTGRLAGTAREVGDALRPPAELPRREAHPVSLVFARCPEEA